MVLSSFWLTFHIEQLVYHVGDGVENAFAFSRKVLTLSLHKQQEGYFPGTGAVSSVGLGAGRFHACNVPIRDGAKDAVFVKILTT